MVTLKEYSAERSPQVIIPPEYVATIQQIEELMRKEVDVSTLDYCIVLGASMDQDTNSDWLLPDEVISDKGRLVGGWSRAVAARRIIEQNFQGKFLVTGGSQYDSKAEMYVSRARVLAHAMVINGVPPQQVEIVGKEGTGNTLGNIENTVEYFKSISGSIDAPIPDGTEIGMLSNEWHLKRSLLFFSHNPYFVEHGIQVVPVNVDNYLREMPEHQAWVNHFNSHPKMEKRREEELQGIIDFLRGNYEPLSK